jgi:hypothetical protein
VHEPLSQSLQKLLTSKDQVSGVTLNELLERTEGRGIYLVMVVLSLPFVIPVSIPGFSTVFGAGIIILAMRMALGLPPHLPKSFGQRSLSPTAQKRLLTGGVKLLRFIEKGVRPRKTQWLTWRAARAANALLITFLAVLLALPIPPVIPFTNSFPSYAIIFIAISMMEEDGVLIWAGYVMSLVAVVYLAVMGEVIATHLGKWIQSLIHLFAHT